MAIYESFSQPLFGFMEIKLSISMGASKTNSILLLPKCAKLYLVSEPSIVCRKLLPNVVVERLWACLGIPFPSMAYEHRIVMLFVLIEQFSLGKMGNDLRCNVSLLDEIGIDSVHIVVGFGEPELLFLFCHNRLNLV